MTSPVLEPRAPRRKRRSSFKRQRLAVFITLGVVVLLAVAFALVSYFTARGVFEDHDGTKYYIVKVDGAYVMRDADGNLLPTTADGNYLTAKNTIVTVDAETGDFSVVAAVDVEGEETLQFSAYSGQFDILMYPFLEREDISSIEVYNTKVIKDESGKETKQVNHFTFIAKDDDFEIREYPDLDYEPTLFSTLVICTGYTNTYMRLDREKVKEYGYGEYGLPEEGEEAENYFIITDTAGKSHKVIIGDETPPGTGYYARYEGREDVYILKELEQTTYSSTFSAALFAQVEDYVQPTVSVPMQQNNYFDVTNFNLSSVAAITDAMLNDPDLDVDALMNSIISFSYSPIEQRRNTFLANIPYTGTGKYEGFGINSTKVDICLQNIRDISAGRTVKVFTEEENESGLFYFAKNYGIGYCIEFVFNAERDADNDYKVKDDAQYYQQIWISKRNERGSYYMYNEVFSMIVEVSRSSLEYLDMDAFDWVDNTYINGNIVFLEGMEIFVPGGVEVDGTSKKHFSFEIDNTQSLEGLGEQMQNIPSDKMLVWESGDAVDLAQFKLFYQTLLRSELGGEASCSQAWQEACRDAALQAGHENATVKPLLVIKMVYNTKADGSGEEIVRTYCFYPYEKEGYQSFTTLNGNGAFYIVSSRVQKIISDLGKLFSGEEIKPTAKY